MLSTNSQSQEIINFPSTKLVKHLGCRRVKEHELVFDSHMSGFVYKVLLDGQPLIKKEIPSPDTIEEFLYEINALSALEFSPNVIQFNGVVVDENDEFVKGLLISYAEQGALMDIIYDNCKESHLGIPWKAREKWAQQIVRGLADVHESGFVQGDFTLSNVVIDEAGDAKIIDINRRGCPVRWEPPEATALIESGQRLSLFIGVKSDLFQLGMVLWALAMEEDEPENQGRPLMLGPENNVPDWFRQITEICLSSDPRCRLAACRLVQMMPPLPVLEPMNPGDEAHLSTQSSFYNPDSHQQGAYPQTTTTQTLDPAQQFQRPLTYDPFYTTRGRSPPSPMPSNSSRDRLAKAKAAGNGSLLRAANGIQALPTQTLPHRQFIPTPDHDSPLGPRCESPRGHRAGRMRAEDSNITAMQDLAVKPDERYERLPNDGFAKDQSNISHVSGINNEQTTKPMLEAVDSLMDFRQARRPLTRRVSSSYARQINERALHDADGGRASKDWNERRQSPGSAPTESVIPDWISEIVSRASTPDIDVEGGANLSSDAEEAAALERDLAYGSVPPMGHLTESHSNQTVLRPGVVCSKEERARRYIEGIKASSSTTYVGMGDEFSNMTDPRLPAF